MVTQSKSAIFRLLNYAKSYRKDIYLATLYSFLNKLFDVFPEVLIGVAVDTVVNRQSSLLGRIGFPNLLTQLYILGTLTFFIWCFESLFEYLYSVKWRNLAQALQHKLRMDAYTHIQNADIKYFESIKTGNLVAILNDDINQLERFLDNGANTVIQIFSSTIIIGIIFFILDPKVALLALLPIPLILFGSYYFQRIVTPRYASVRDKAGELAARFANNITGIATIKSFTAENHEIRSLEKQSTEYQYANSRAIALSSAINPIIRIAILLGFLATLLYGGWQALNGQLAIGAYSVLVFLTQRLLWPLTDLADITDQYYRAMASANRVLNLLQTPIQIISGNHSGVSASIRGHLTFNNVSFGYHPNYLALRNLSLDIPAGSSAAFVGHTGSGKSTLIKLLLRFYDPVEGTIFLDNRNLKEYDLLYLRKHIGYVSQDVFLFDGTVAENIAYGSFDKNQSVIEQAAKLAEAHEFIVNLPQGYHTQVGERGQQLSGGQRQRVGLARALLKNPPILILDEATSAVDNETESAIQKSLKKIVINRTTIMIAHRLSTIRHVDQIYVLEAGQIVEQGTHDELLIKQGIYADLWKLQTGEEAQTLTYPEKSL
jgi:ATP-binding cassette subfamily B protein